MSRRQEILETAWALFESRGYEHTSTNDIIKEIGIARGTLYHYFSSKEEILDTLIDHIGQKMLTNADQIAENKDIPVFQRLALVNSALNMQSNASFVLDQMHQAQNALMHEKINQVLLRDLPRIFVKIIEDGVQQGLMETDYPLETCEWLVAYILTSFDYKQDQADSEQSLRRLQALVYNLERLLATPKGVFDFILDNQEVQDETGNK